MRLLSNCTTAILMLFLLAGAAGGMEQSTHRSTSSSRERQIGFDIPAQPLPKALKAVGDEAQLTILFADDVDVESLSPTLRGTYTVDEALSRLLENTGLDFKYVDATTVVVKKSAGAGSERLSVVHDGSGKSSIHRETTPDTGPPVPVEASDVESDDVVITGSRLKDKRAADSSSQRVYGQDALEQSGAATLAELPQLFPENFNSVNPISSLFGNTVGAPQLGNNQFLGGGFNLSGLGPEATLTLLDGDRWVSGGASGTFFDLSLLPMNAVASIVTLSGDTSAVYGSDAIAGVVNILLRPGTDGNETSVRYGTTSDGGAGQWVFSQRLGRGWQSGDAMIAYQRAQQSPVLSTARSYIPAVSPAIDIAPRQTSSGLLSRLDHQLNQDTSVKAHFLYGARDVSDDSGSFGGYLLKRDSPVKEYGGTVHIDHSVTPEWTIGFYGSYSRLTQSLTTSVPGALTQSQRGDASMRELGLSANAEPVSLFGRPVRFTFGAGGRKDTLTVPTSAYQMTYSTLARKVGDIYVETLLPLIKESHPLLRRLEVSLVVREDYYEAVGPTLNPKTGLVWSPVSDLSLRGTFARSFRPPTLDELAPIPLYYTVNIPDRTSPTGVTDTLVDQSQGISRLKSEIARTITGGLDYRRDGPGGWAGSVSWFRTVFDNRVATPLVLASSAGPTTDIFAQPALASYISRSIDLTQIQSIFTSPAFAQDLAGTGPSGVRATFDNQPTNIERTFEEGLEASLRYSSGEKPRQLSAFVIANYLLRDTYRLTPGTPTTSLVNNVGQPPSLRARGGVTWSRNDWRTTLNLNYTGSYRDLFVSPTQPVSSWTTLDFQLARQLPLATLTAQNVQLTFDARNILNTAPPWVAVPAAQSLRPVGFDAANASPFGRRFSLEVSVAW